MIPEYRSTSQRRTFRACGFKYQMQYGHGWRSKLHRGSYEFGDVMQALADAIDLQQIRWGSPAGPDEAAEFFLEAWAGRKENKELLWTSRQTWEMFNARGPALAKLMAVELPARLHTGPHVERVPLLNERIDFELAPGVKEVAIPDRYGYVDGKLTILDFKTSDRAYEETAAEIDEQLSDYQCAEESLGRKVEQVGLCVLLYTATPRIQWLLCPARDPEEIARFKAGAISDDRRIKAEDFTRNERSCHTMGACAMIPICYPSQRERIAAELVKKEQAQEEPEVLGWDD